jgi:hypothetical protein
LNKQPKLPKFVGDAFVGWLAGVGGVIGFGLFWLIAFPAIVRPEHYYGFGPTFIQVTLMAILVASPAALIGGIVGGRVSIEGGRGAQRMVSVVFAIIFSIPFTCYMFWLFTGY